LFSFLYFKGFLKKQLYGFWGNFACGIQRVVPIIALAFAGYEMILVNSALCVSTSLVGYLSSHIQERQQFYFPVGKYFQFQQEKIIFTSLSHRKTLNSCYNTEKLIAQPWKSDK